ncbi:MAG: hypothetical protein L0228_07540 [Planctomycetes bacterium]|nr:hypothetical protein [Planctomycetota bacterium]
MLDSMQRYCLRVALVVSLVGCGGGTTSVSRVEANAAYQEGVAALDERNYQAALDKLTIAADSGWLNPDFAVDAIAKRAVANAALGNFTVAGVDLDRIQSAPDQSIVLAAKAFVLQKQGRTAEAGYALKQAKRLNPAIRPFE